MLHLYNFEKSRFPPCFFGLPGWVSRPIGLRVMPRTRFLAFFFVKSSFFSKRKKVACDEFQNLLKSALKYSFWKKQV